MHGEQGGDKFSCRDTRCGKADGGGPAAALRDGKKEQNGQDADSLLDQLADCRHPGLLQTEIIATDAAVYGCAWECIRYDHEQIRTPLVAKK